MEAWQACKMKLITTFDHYAEMLDSVLSNATVRIVHNKKYNCISKINIDLSLMEDQNQTYSFGYKLLSNIRIRIRIKGWRPSNDLKCNGNLAVTQALSCHRPVAIGVY